MKIDVDQVLMSYGKVSGTKEEIVDKTNGEKVTLRVICINALMYFNAKNPENIDGVEKLARGKIADKIFEGGVVELDSKEITKIEDILGKFFSTMIHNAVYNLLEQKGLSK